VVFCSVMVFSFFLSLSCVFIFSEAQNPWAWDAALPRSTTLYDAVKARFPVSLHSAQPQAGGLGSCPRPPQPVPLPKPPPAAILELINKVANDLDVLFEKANATGGVGVLVYGDEVLLTHTYGTKQLGEKSPVDGSTMFRIGSISKVFTDLMLHRLHEDGKVGIDDPVTKFVPNYRPKWPPGKNPTKRGTTLRDLGSHMAALMRYCPCNFGVSCNITLETALERINEWTLLFEPGTAVMYSNTGFSVLGRLLEKVEGKPWEESLQDLAKILGMESTSCSPDLNDLAFGYSANGQQVPLYDLGISNPAGGVFSSGDDMARFLSFLLRDGVSRDDNSGQPLDSATVRSWLKTRVLTNPSNVPAPSLYYTEWGVPWQNLRVNLDSVAPGIPPMKNFSRFFIISKDGSVPGYNSQLALQPDLKLGLFASMTTGGSREVPSFFSDVLMTLAFQAAPLMYSYLEGVQPSKLPPSPQDYLGEYRGRVTGGTASVSISNDPSGQFGGKVLYVMSNNLGWPQPQPIEWLEGDTFQMVPEPSDVCFSIEGGILWVLKFKRSSKGEVSQVEVQGMTMYPVVLQRTGY